MRVSWDRDAELAQARDGDFTTAKRERPRSASAPPAGRVYTKPRLTLGEVAESAEGSRLLSGYRGKTSVPGSNPGLSAIQLAHRPSGHTSQEELSVVAKPGTGLMMAGAIVAFSGLCIVLVEVLRVPPYAVLLVVGVGMFVLGLIRRFSREDRDRI